MLDTSKSWPFGLSSGYAPRFVAIVLLVLSGLVFLDRPVANAVKSLPEWVVQVFDIITRIGDAEWILLPTLALAIFGSVALRVGSERFRTNNFKYLTFVSAFLFFSTAGPGLVANMFKRLIGRARPMHLEELGLFHFQPVLNDWTFQSFPSGHASTMFAFATGVIFLFPKLRWWVLSLAALVGLSRIIIGMHYPTDIFAGFLFGIIAAFAVRNICLWRNLIFTRNANGKIVPKAFFNENYITAR
ncbi:MAG: phosphatase PAP2 family protein [Devosiaceae bacterium]|nr:phosphatase PAP2 family protein [Devosiaceae bacterium]